MNRKVYCSCDSDFTKHYQQQVGFGFSDISVYSGQPYQRGYGIGSTIKRFGWPLLKFLGKHLLKTGVSVGSDYLLNNDFSSVKNQSKQGLKNAAKDGLHEIEKLVDQYGTGIRKQKRKSNNKNNKNTKRAKIQPKKKKKDIFS